MDGRALKAGVGSVHSSCVTASRCRVSSSSCVSRERALLRAVDLPLPEAFLVPFFLPFFVVLDFDADDDGAAVVETSLGMSGGCGRRSVAAPLTVRAEPRLADKADACAVAAADAATRAARALLRAASSDSSPFSSSSFDSAMVARSVASFEGV